MENSENNQIINIKDIASRLDYDFELFRELADLFIVDSQRLIEKLSGAIDSSDMPGTRKIAHTLKGSISNFSCERAYNSAYDLEKAAGDSAVEKIAPAYNMLKEDLEKLQKTLKVIMQMNSFQI